MAVDFGRTDTAATRTLQNRRVSRLELGRGLGFQTHPGDASNVAFRAVGALPCLVSLSFPSHREGAGASVKRRKGLRLRAGCDHELARVASFPPWCYATPAQRGPLLASLGRFICIGPWPCPAATLEVELTKLVHSTWDVGQRPWASPGSNSLGLSLSVSIRFGNGRRLQVRPCAFTGPPHAPGFALKCEAIAWALPL